MVDEQGANNNDGHGDDEGARLEALEAKFNGVVAGIDKIMSVIGDLQKTEPTEDKQQKVVDDLKGKPVDKQLESLASTVELLAGAVNKIANERQAEQQAAAAAAAAKRDALIDQVVKALPEYSERRDDLKSVPTSVLEMMLNRKAGKTDDPKAPVKTGTKRLSIEEASKIAVERKQNQRDTLLSMSTFGQRK